MSERKVLNKYFPPDFDPARIPRRKVKKDKKIKVRLMTPFSMRCNTCGEYIYRGKKFNAKKELSDEEYLGIQIFRFYIRCNRCAATITFKTDPKNNDYAAEYGAQRKFDDLPNVNEDPSAKENKDNIVEVLENRTLDSKREMDIIEALDEIRVHNTRSELKDSEEVLSRMVQDKEKELEEKRRLEDEEDSRIAAETFSKISKEREETQSDNLIGTKELMFKPTAKSHEVSSAPTKRSNREEKARSLGILLKKRKNG